MNADGAVEIARIRQFSRTFVNRMGLLNKPSAEGVLSMIEARLLYEIDACPRCTASDLRDALAVDAGYLSRVLKSLAARRLIVRKRMASDKRRQSLSLTRTGRTALRAATRALEGRIGKFLDGLDREARARLFDALGDAGDVLGGAAEAASVASVFVVRPFRPGDVGRVLERHGVLYAKESDFDMHILESDVAAILAEIVDTCRFGRSCLWVAESGPSFAGCAAMIEREQEVAQFRLFLVEPRFRRMGLGRRLVEVALGFAREKRFKTAMLRTVDAPVNARARQLYYQSGFRVAASAPATVYGREVVEEQWELAL